MSDNLKNEKNDYTADQIQVLEGDVYKRQVQITQDLH